MEKAAEEHKEFECFKDGCIVIGENTIKINSITNFTYDIVGTTHERNLYNRGWYYLNDYSKIKNVIDYDIISEFYKKYDPRSAVEHYNGGEWAPSKAVFEITILGNKTFVMETNRYLAEKFAEELRRHMTNSFPDKLIRVGE